MSRDSTPDLVHELYDPRIQAARDRFAGGPGKSILRTEMTADEVVLFLIHFSSWGVKMTEPVESWIGRAGEQCDRRGYTALGRALTLHAKHEANHHLMMVEDTRKLVALWNRRHSRPLDAAAFLDAPPPASVLAYSRLHEDVIAGQAPFAQLAIEYEIESLSVTFGPSFVAHCARIAGGDVLEGLSFIEEHAALDVGHTRFNRVELQKLITLDAAHVEPLVHAGTAALDTYGSFLEDCMVRATRSERGPHAEAPVAVAG